MAGQVAEAPADQPELRELAQDVRALAAAGLEALDRREKKTPPGDYSALIEKHKKIAAASAGFIESFVNQQPASELMIAFVPALDELLAAARLRGAI